MRYPVALWQDFGGTYTVLRNPKDELKKGTLHAMCTQLGISVNDL